MLLFLISCFSFVLLSKSLTLNFPMLNKWKLILSPWFWNKLPSSSILIAKFKLGKLLITLPLKKKVVFSNSKSNPETLNYEISLLDLPELTLDCILDKLPPSELSKMATVCTSMRDKCRSDYLWEKHLKRKWIRVLSEGAYREWQWFVASKTRLSVLNRRKMNGFLRVLNNLSGFCWVRSNLMRRRRRNVGETLVSSLRFDSVMGLYIALESGKFWFPAQVYNRENGNAGFMLSCYDAQLSYDSRTDTFQARYLPHRRRMMEENITWDKIRAPPIDNPAHVLHVSNCLHDLKPRDHIEIQWRRNNDFSYGWWYGVVGHLELCDRNEDHCNCRFNDTIILEFNQYTPDSRWRRTTVNRKVHREEGNEADGFYGGIRKVYKEDEISMWKRLWPKKFLE